MSSGSVSRASRCSSARRLVTINAVAFTDVQRQGLLRVAPIRAGQTHGERHASPVANQMALAPPLRPIGGIRTSMVTTMHRADGTAVHDRSRPINLILSSEPIQQREVNENPTRPLVANRAGGANTSSPNRTRVPAGASANRCRCGGRTKCRSGTRDPKCAAVRPSADVVQWARTVRLDPTMDREAALQPYPFTRLRRRGSGFGGFVTYS
jgi:hypothetical protein